MFGISISHGKSIILEVEVFFKLEAIDRGKLFKVYSGREGKT